MDPEIARIVTAMRAAVTYQPDPDVAPVVLSLPFKGRWLAVNTPARKVPSHGTHFFGQTYAIDFVAVDERRRTSTVRDWRTLVATEPAERFYAYGLPVLSPAAGQVVAVHDGEPDHAAYRSLPTAVAYMLSQLSRLRRGTGAIAGNSVVLSLGQAGPYVLLAHLQSGSIRVAPGDTVTAGQELAACGNSGNSTQPHLHIQVMDSMDPIDARGLPMAFRAYRVWPRRRRWSRGEPAPVEVPEGVPGHREVVERIPRRKPGHRARRR